MPPAPPPTRRAESPGRRALRVMLMQVFGLHIAAIAVHQLADISLRPAGTRMAFLGAWLLATVAIVGVGLRRVRVARQGSRGVPAP